MPSSVKDGRSVALRSATTFTMSDVVLFQIHKTLLAIVNGSDLAYAPGPGRRLNAQADSLTRGPSLVDSVGATKVNSESFHVPAQCK